MRKMDEQAVVPELAFLCVTRAIVLLHQEEIRTIGTHPGIAPLCKEVLVAPQEAVEDFLKKPQVEWKEVDFKVRRLANELLNKIRQERGWK